jgi:alpha-tubulin suppressor-like RCC1 family protein
VQVHGLGEHPIVQVAAGGTHTLALSTQGRMYVWGRASFGRLGTGSEQQDLYSPAEIQLPGE